MKTYGNIYTKIFPLMLLLLLYIFSIHLHAKKRPQKASKLYYLTAEEINKVYESASQKRAFVSTYDPFLSLLGALALGYSDDPRELIVTQDEFEKMMLNIAKKTLFKEFLWGFKSIRFTRNKEIITTTERDFIRFKIPKAFGTYISIFSGFRLKVFRQKDNIIVKVITPESVHFRIHQTRLSKLRGVIDMDIRRLILTPQKNKKGKDELIAFIDGYVPLWPFGDASLDRPARYKKYRIRVNLTTLGTFSGSRFVRGDYLQTE